MSVLLQVILVYVLAYVVRAVENGKLPYLVSNVADGLITGVFAGVLLGTGWTHLYNIRKRGVVREIFKLWTLFAPLLPALVVERDHYRYFYVVAVFAVLLQAVSYSRIERQLALTWDGRQSASDLSREPVMAWAIYAMFVAGIVFFSARFI